MHDLSENIPDVGRILWNLRCKNVPIDETANIALKYLFSWTLVEMVSCVSGHALLSQKGYGWNNAKDSYEFIM